MLENLRFYIVYLALFTGIVGVLFYYKLPSNKAKSIVALIFFSFLIELIGQINLKQLTGLLNYFIFNFYMLVSFSYYIIILKTLLSKISHKVVANLFLIIFLLFYIVNLIFIQKNITETFTYSFSLGVIFVLILAGLYIIEIFNSGKILNFRESIYFWFILGVLLFHVPFLPFMLAIKWVLINSSGSIYSFVLFILNVLMYGCFITGFICSKKKYNY